MLFDPGVDELGRERQVLDRGPSRACTDLHNAQVEGAGVGAVEGTGRHSCRSSGREQASAVGSREQSSVASRTVRDVAVRSEHRRAPGRVPVVLVVSAHVPGIGLRDAGAGRSSSTQPGVHAIKDVTVGQAAAVEDSEATSARRVPGAAEDVLGSAVGEGGFNLQAVAHAGRQVLQLESAANCEAPGRIGVTRSAVARGVVSAVHFVSRGSEVQRTPSLVDAEVADDIRNMVASRGVAQEAVRGGAVEAVLQAGCGNVGAERTEKAGRGVDNTRGAVGLSVFDRNRRRHAVAERSGISQLVDTGRVVRTGEEARGDVGLRERPLRVELRNGLTEGEPSELDEREVDFSEAARDVFAASRPVELQVGVGADNAVFGGGARINEQVQTRTSVDVVLVVGAGAVRATLPIGRVVNGAVERRIDTQRTTDANAGISAGDVIETRAVEGADLHVLDRFGLDGKIGCLCAGQRDETRRGAEHKALNHLHVNLQVCSLGRVPVPSC